MIIILFIVIYYYSIILVINNFMDSRGREKEHRNVLTIAIETNG